MREVFAKVKKQVMFYKTEEHRAVGLPKIGNSVIVSSNPCHPNLVMWQMYTMEF